MWGVISMRNEDLYLYYKRKYPITFNRGGSPADKSSSKHYEAAWQIAEQAAVMLKQHYNARRVVVFGSLADRSFFMPWSDIDIAVLGVPDEVFYAAVGAITGLSTEFDIDLVDMAGCSDSLRKVIEAEGIEL